MSNFSPTILVVNIAHQLDPMLLIELDPMLLIEFDPTSLIELDPTSLTGLDVQLFADAFNGQVRLEALVCDNIACGHAHLATQSGELFLCCAPFLFAWYVYFFLLGTSISFYLVLLFLFFLLHLWRYTAVYTVK